MLERAAKALGEPSKALVIVFAAVGMATIQFVRHAPPATDILEMPPLVTALTFLVVVFVPTAVFFAADRALAGLDRSGRWLRAFRIGLLSVAALLTLREMQLYFSPVHAMYGLVDDAPKVLLLSLALLLLPALVVAFSRFYEPVCQFAQYLSPVAALLMLITMVQMGPVRAVPGNYGDTATAADSRSGPPVFALVFDELGFEALAPDGQIDAERYPNFAALADDGLMLTNGTTNFFHTTFVLPTLVEGIAPLGDQSEIVLYDEYGYVESLFFAGCGTSFTCRGNHYVASKSTGSLLTDMLFRTAYEAIPNAVEDSIAAPMGWLAERVGTVLPSVDPFGIHVITDEQYDTMIADIDAEESYGRIHFLHTLTPHTPFIWDAEKKATTDPDYTSFRIQGPDSDEVNERFLKQIEYSDTLLGGLVAKLKEEGIYDDSVIVVTGDHGLRRVSPLVDEAIDLTGATARVPLIIHAPGIAPGTVSDVDYQHIDFGATVAAASGLDYPEDARGISALATDRPDRDKVIYLDDDNERYWVYVYNEATGTWDVTEMVDHPLRDYSENSVVHAPDGPTSNAD